MNCVQDNIISTGVARFQQSFQRHYISQPTQKTWNSPKRLVIRKGSIHLSLSQCRKISYTVWHVVILGNLMNIICIINVTLCIWRSWQGVVKLAQSGNPAINCPVCSFSTEHWARILRVFPFLATGALITLKKLRMLPYNCTTNNTSRKVRKSAEHLPHICQIAKWKTQFFE